MQKVALQKGLIAPKDVGLKSSVPMPNPNAGGGNQPSSKNKGQPQQGRPKNSKDGQKRKKKEFKPVGASLAWVKYAQKHIADSINPIYLNTLGKKNLRSLSVDEFEKLEMLNFTFLMGLKPNSDLSSVKLVRLKDQDILTLANACYYTSLDEFKSNINNQPTVEDKRNIMASIYMEIHNEEIS